ncbi:aspartate carbamoyltransferase catalytic subunit [Candidatus Viadribacter manganicus]|uniref:Aspartate carbamoyltransferase n=1 Tax=Candidatus Viadribacter manganicus TaxID=1759059 RepID=A0A1B1AM70_9PROT|nr:aspartate carbamoyltransferase catalytic subunit [Candidatus Viadribacter manganicus]ANP47635.1 aspartate carbamoyltransferase catalytic subunit [Candidatus Viadribacter manganicus]
MAQRPTGVKKTDESARAIRFRQKHLLAIADLDRFEAENLLDRAEKFAPLLDERVKKLDTLRGRTLINLFFENSTRTQSSFELAGKRMGADVVNMSVKSSSVAKGETLIDTAATLNAMRPDLLVVRHGSSGAAELLSRKVDCAVINAGDGKHEHPTQALLDAFTIRSRLGGVEGLIIAICGDVLHSRVARSNVALLTLLGAQVRLIGPPTLMPAGAEKWGAKVFHDMRAGLKDADVVMMLRVQRERMTGGFFPSAREYFWFYGLDEEKLRHAKPGALVMHPGPMNRGVEIDSTVADNASVSLIETQVRMGVAVRMAVLEALAESGANEERS